MRVAKWKELVGGKLDVQGEVALTFGVFDGIHPGHRRLFELLEANRGAAVPAVFTFRENPQKLLAPATYPGDVLSPRQKLDLLEENGIELVVQGDFDHAFRSMSGAEFLGKLTDRLSISYAAVGPDFHCGRNMDTDARGVARYFSEKGIRVDIASAVYHNTSPVSSTRIRRSIAAGNFEAVRGLLGGSFVLDLRDVNIETGRYGAWVPRQLIQQVIPFSGVFRSTVFSAYGRTDGVVHVDPEGIRITASAGEDATTLHDGIEQIEFLAEMGTEIEGEINVAYERGKG